MKRIAHMVSRHLLVSVTFCFVSGILFAPWLVSSFLSHQLLIGFVLAILALAILFYSLGRTDACLVLLVPLFFCLGCYHCLLRLQTPDQPHHIYNQITTKQEVIVMGTMISMVSFNGTISKVVIAVKSIRFKESPEFHHSEGNILLAIKDIWPTTLLPGDTLAIRADLKRPESYRTPGTFDYAKYLAQKDIWITGFIRSPLFLHQLDPPQSPLHKLRFFPERVRTIIGKQIDMSIQNESAGVYRAILIGDRSRVSDAASESFKKSGTFHILAISGLHMAVIGAILYAVLYWLLSRSEKLLLLYNIRKIAAVSCLPVLIFYTQIAGMNTPVVRSVIMSCIVIFALCTDRKKSPGPLLAAAGMLILVFDPLQLFTVSFQLSFVAISSIIYLLPILQSLLLQKREEYLTPKAYFPRLLQWAIAGFLVSVVATVATAPISLYAFNRISVIGPVANLVIEPLFCLWSLTFGFIAIPFIFIYPSLSTILFQLGAKGLQVGLFAAQQFSSLPFASIRIATPPFWLIFVWYALILLLAIFYTRRSVYVAATSATLLLISFLTFILVPEYFFSQNSSLKVSFLDVGQGTATVVEYPSGFRLLVDGGSSSSHSVGERVIAPFLWNKGIDHIDAIAITHPDSDHYNGLQFIIKHFRPTTLWVRDTHGHDWQYQHLMHFAQATNKVSIVVPTDGLQLISESGADLRCIANTGAWHVHNNKRNREKENSGLVLKACANDFCILFPGDIGQTYEELLSDNSFELKSDILLAPHHGSATSNSELFLQAVSPTELVVSAGRSRKKTFPSTDLRNLCKKRDIQLSTTFQQGTLEITAEQKRYSAYAYQRINSNPLQPFERVLLPRH